MCSSLCWLSYIYYYVCLFVIYLASDIYKISKIQTNKYNKLQRHQKVIHFCWGTNVSHIFRRQNFDTIHDPDSSVGNVPDLQIWSATLPLTFRWKFYNHDGHHFAPCFLFIYFFIYFKMPILYFNYMCSLLSDHVKANLRNEWVKFLCTAYLQNLCKKYFTCWSFTKFSENKGLCVCIRSENGFIKNYSCDTWRLKGFHNINVRR